MKVYLNSQEDAQATVKNAKSLKNSREFGGVFIAPDRSPEERIERRRLVQLLREKRQNEPEKHHYISRGAVCSTDHQTSNNVIITQNSILVHEGLQNCMERLELLDKSLTSFSEGMSEMNSKLDEGIGKFNR